MKFLRLKKAEVVQPNKPKPTTTLPQNMEWSWDPEAADWVAVMKDNTNVTPPLYNPQNQNLVNNNATTYMSTVKSSENFDEESLNNIWVVDMFLDNMDSEDGHDTIEFTKIGLIDWLNSEYEDYNSTNESDLEMIPKDITNEQLKREVSDWCEGKVIAIKPYSERSASKKVESTSVDGLDFPIKTWYTHVFKQDKLGEEIDPNVTFQDVLDNPQDVYKLLGVGDSTIRERVFTEISRKTNKSGDDIYNRWLGQVKSSCLSEFLDGPRYSKEIKIEAGLIKEGLLKYAGFDFNRGTKYAITEKGLKVLRSAAEKEHNEALNEREKLAYMFGFNTDKETTLDTTGKVIKSDKKFHIHLPGSFYTQEIYGETIDDALESYGYKKDEIVEWYDDEGNGEYIGNLVECDLCGEKYEADELVSTDMGNVCFKCKKSIESREGPMNNKNISEAKQYLEKYLLENPELFKYQYGKDNVEEVLKELIEENPNWYKKFSSKKWTICEADGTPLGKVIASSELDAKVKFGIEHPEYADSQSISAKEIKADLIHKGIFEYHNYKINLFDDTDGGATFVIYAPEDKTVNHEKMYKGTALNLTQAIDKSYKIINREIGIVDAKYEETTKSHEPYPNLSETPHDDIVLENHDGWVNTAEQKVTPEFAQLHSILGEYKKKGHILSITQDGKDLLVSCSPIASYEMKQKFEQLGYECEETDESETGDAYDLPSYTLRIKMR